MSLPSLDDLDFDAMRETPEQEAASLQRYCDQFAAAGEYRVKLTPAEAAAWRGHLSALVALAEFDAIP